MDDPGAELAWEVAHPKHPVQVVVFHQETVLLQVGPRIILEPDVLVHLRRKVEPVPPVIVELPWVPFLDCHLPGDGSHEIVQLSPVACRG